MNNSLNFAATEILQYNLKSYNIAAYIPLLSATSHSLLPIVSPEIPIQRYKPKYQQGKQ